MQTTINNTIVEALSILVERGVISKWNTTVDDGKQATLIVDFRPQDRALTITQVDLEEGADGEQFNIDLTDEQALSM